MLKICHVGMHMYGGGAEIFLGNLSRKFQKIKITQSFLINKNFYNEEFAQSMPFPISICEPKNILKSIEKYDLVINWGPVPLNDILQTKKIKTCVFIAHSDMSRGSFELCNKVVSHVIAVSNEIKNKICFDSNVQVSVCYPGVDKSRLISNFEKNSAREFFKIDSKKTVIGWMGSFVQCKRIDRLISFSKNIKDNYHLLIAGDGPLFEEFKKIKQNNITFLGKINCVEKFYKAIDIFCLPSDAEGCPQVMFESMCCKIPFIATPISAIKEIVKHKQNGLIFDGSENCFFECLSFLENKKNYENIQIAGYDTFEKIGDIEKTSNQYESILIDAYIKNIYKNKML